MALARQAGWDGMGHHFGLAAMLSRRPAAARPRNPPKHGPASLIYAAQWLTL